MKIYNLLKGEFLVNDESFKNWKIIMFVVLLLLCMIFSSHSADSKVIKIAEMNKHMKMLKSLYIDSETTLTRIKMESYIRDKVKYRDLTPSKTPPIKIIVTSKRK